MSDNRRRQILEKTAFSGGRRVVGHLRDANHRIVIRLNHTYTPNGDSWIDNQNGDSFYGTSDDDKYFEIAIPDDYHITSLASMCGTTDYENGVDIGCVNNLVDINLAYMGDVKDVESMLYMFDSNNYLKLVTGMSKFNTMTKLRTVEGMFRSNKSIEKVDFTGLNTSGMDKSIMPRYGFPVWFYQISSIKTIILPEMPRTAYAGSATFQDCTGLVNVTATEEIAVNHMWFSNSPLSVASIKSILSHLTDDPIIDPDETKTASCRFKEKSWKDACADEECYAYAHIAKDNGWLLPDIIEPPVYKDDLSDDEKYADGRTSDTWFSFGIEYDSTMAGYERVYVMMYEPGSSSPFDYWTMDITGNAQYVNLLEASTMTISMQGLPLGTTRNNITTNNAYMTIALGLEDYDGNVSSWYVPSDTVSTSQIDINVNMSQFSGVDTSKITKIRMSMISPNGSLSTRRKGLWMYGVRFDK